jgi:hypothetical protein
MTSLNISFYKNFDIILPKGVGRGNPVIPVFFMSEACILPFIPYFGDILIGWIRPVK